MAHHSARSTSALPVCAGFARPTAVQSGFTLVELVLVIVILGILAATAAPRFASLDREARIALVEQAAGSVRSGATLVYSKAQIMSPPETSQYGSVPIGGGTVINTNYGYPNAADVYHELLIDSTAFTPFSTGSYLTEFRLDGASNPATCKLVYIAPDTADKQAQITVETTGC